MAFRYERTHPGAVIQSCEVYRIGRHMSVLMAVGGVWFDYLYFDSQDSLVGYHRRFLD